MFGNFVAVAVLNRLHFDLLSVQSISQLFFPHHFVVQQFSVQLLHFFPVFFLQCFYLLHFFFHLQVQVLHIFFHLFVSIFQVAYTSVVGVDCLLHHFFLPLKLVDSVFQKLLFGLDEFDLFFFRRNDLAEFLLEFPLQFFDPLFVFGFHLLDDFFVDSNLLIEGVDDDVLFLFHVLEFIHEAVVDGFELPVF